MKVEVFTPENLHEVPLSSYQAFSKIENPTELDVLTAFLGLSKEVLTKIPHKQTKALTADILQTLSQEQTFIESFTLNGKTFGFVPDLDAMSFGEYQDVTSYFGDWEQMHKAMAVLYRPIVSRRKGRYLIEEYEGSAKYAQELKDMPLSVALGTVVFFYALSKDLVKAIPNYLLRQPETLQALKRDFSESGEGITRSLHLLTQTLGDLMKLPDCPFTAVSPSLHTKQTSPSTNKQN